MASWIIKRDGQPSPFQARFRPPGGRTVSKSFKLEREAKAWLAERRAELEAGDYIDPRAGGGSFEVYASAWLDRRHVKPSSGERDASYMRSLILPTFGTRTLNAITADEVENWIVGLRDNDYASATIRKAKDILGGVFNDAVERGKLARSPMPSAARLRKIMPKVAAPTMRFLTRKEFDRLADHIDPAYKAMAFVGSYGGLRWGEAAALRPRDVDLERRQLKVHATLAQPVRGVPFRDESMKTAASRRTIALGGLTEILAAHIKDHASKDWLFTTKSGAPLHATNWRRQVWTPAAEAAGLIPPALRFHDLRHSCAAWLIEQGEPLLVVQERLGHASPSVTLETYSHLFPGVGEAAAEKLTEGI